MPPGGTREPRARSRSSFVPAWLRHSIVVFVVLLVVEYFVVPELIGADKDVHLLSHLDPWWLATGAVLEAASLVSYALLTRTVLLGHKPSLFRVVRITLATTAVAHVIPGGAAGGAGVGYQLLTADGVDGADAGFALATDAIGSAIVLNAMLWVALILSIPVAGVHPLYVTIALLGLLALLGAAGLVYAFTRGEERAVTIVRALGRRVPRVGADRLEHLVRQLGDSLDHLARDRAVLKRAALWACSNWLLDAASLWAFLAAFGHYLDPIELFAAYGIANVLAAIPLTPGGLGIVEASAATLLVGFGTPRNVATLGVLGWRLVNFWLPIPIGAIAYLTLRVPRGSGLRAHRRALTTMTTDRQRDPEA